MKAFPSLFAALVAAAAACHAAEFYIDPEAGAPDNSGSAARPWRSLQEVLDRGLVESRTWDAAPHNEDSVLVPRHPGAPVTGGDTIWLRNGEYGALSIVGHYNTETVTIAAAPGHTPRFRSIRVRSSSHWAFRGLHVRPERGADNRPSALFRIEEHGWHGPAHDILVEDCVLQSARDASAWTAEQWNALACNGIKADGARIVLRGNLVRNIDTGISTGGPHALVENNVVENFAGDGLRGLGDHSVFQYNLVKNCYDVNDNHDDGFQSWSYGPDGPGSGEVTGVTLRANTIINFEDPDQPHRGPLQGIGCFDGTYVDWTIENNVVIADHYHGITLLGARGCRIVNNTVFDPDPLPPGPAWIHIGRHKQGAPSKGCVIRNNLTAALHDTEGQDVESDHNLLITDPAKVFLDAARYDLRLRRGGPAIGAGSGEDAPTEDITRRPRPQGTAVDVGAHEYHGQ